MYVASLDNAFIAPTCLGTIFDSRQQLLFEIMTSPGYPIFWPVDASIKSLPIIQYKKIATVQGPTYFYHWVIDRLPSVLLLKDFLLADPEMKLIVNNQNGYIAGYVHEYLDLLGIPVEQRLVAQKNVLYHAETVYFATPFLMEPIPKKLLLKLRQELLTAARKKSISREFNKNLIVIIQRKESDRRIANLNDLLAMINSSFDPNMYETVVFDGSVSVAEQIQIFNKARLIIGVMASGLTNMLYAEPGATVIEIHQTRDYFPPTFNAGVEWCWWLSSAVGLNYWLVLAPFNLADSWVTCPLESISKIFKKIVTK